MLSFFHHKNGGFCGRTFGWFRKNRPGGKGGKKSMKNPEIIQNYIDQHAGEYTALSDQIWEFAEPRFQEYQSSALLKDYLAKEGFSVRSDLAGEKTAFIAEYGKGKPVIAFLGEFDALSGLSQKADAITQNPLKEGACGHGCGHQLLGTGTLAAVAALKECMEKNHLPGTIRYYGCPAEENAGGKAFLVRDGYFDDCDLALCWHPELVRRAVYGSSAANFRVFFTFHGTPAHAAIQPEQGRSALDAVELMNVGVNYMREHMIDAARVHYAVTNTGGTAPNVVQQEAQVLYAIRAPKITQVKALYERVCKIARGAALMTETDVDIRQVSAYSNLISSPVICDQVEKHMEELGPISYTEEELEYARRFQTAIPERNRAGLPDAARSAFGPETGKKQAELPVYTAIALGNHHEDMKGSTDVGDVSWIVPTAQFNVPTFAAGTPFHAWQAVAQGKSSIAHKGMLYAAKIMALTAADFLTEPELVEKAQKVFHEMLGGEKYPNPLPPECKPELW